MPAIVVPFRRSEPKRRLQLEAEHGSALAEAMLADVCAAAEPVGSVVVADTPGGQGHAVARALRCVAGPVLVVNADLPCATERDLRALLAAAPALVAATDGSTNALALTDPDSFEDLYGPGSAGRFAASLGARRVDLPNLANDVDTLADLERVLARAGRHTRAAIAALRRAA